MGILLAHSGHSSTNLAEFKHHSLPTVGYHMYPFVTTVPLSSGGYHLGCAALQQLCNRSAVIV